MTAIRTLVATLTITTAATFVAAVEGEHHTETTSVHEVAALVARTPGAIAVGAA